MNTVLLESRPFRPFKSSEEYLYAMKEDLAEWLQLLYPHLGINVENFMEKLETGVALCEHANAVKHQAIEYIEKKQAKKGAAAMTKSVTGSLAQAQFLSKIAEVKYFSTAKPGTFFARDNVSNFIKWCRICLEIIECLLFESDDLIMRKNEKHVVLCLLEVARRGAKFGMLAPMLVQMERQIDREIAADQKKNASSNSNSINENDNIESDSDIEEEEPVLMYGPLPQIVTNDLKSLDEMVRDLVEKCTCPTQFPMIRVSEGKYRIGDTKVLIFVRILRNHVMVRVGGGWDTLSHYLDKHDPCRCRTQHRATQSARLVNKPGAADLHGSQVYYDRSANNVQPSIQLQSNSGGGFLGPPTNSLNRSRSRSPSYKNGHRRSVSPNVSKFKNLQVPNTNSNRSRSPTPNFTSTHQLTKLVKPNTPSPKKKCVATLQIPTLKPQQQSQSEEIQKTETSLNITSDLTDQSDTTSEMSDEGYRSLGLVVDKSKQRSNSMDDDSTSAAALENDKKAQQTEDLNDVGLRRTQFSQRIYEKDSVATKPKPVYTRSNSLDGASTNSNVKYHHIHGSPQKKLANVQCKVNTWNYSPKRQRSSITPETFNSPIFSRNSSARRSVSAVGYDRKSSSLNTSPTKGKLRQELIRAVKNTDDDEIMALQVQELLRKYGSLNMLDDEEPPPEEQQFKRSNHRMSLRSSRKDSRPDILISRIPAPVSHKA